MRILGISICAAAICLAALPAMAQSAALDFESSLNSAQSYAAYKAFTKDVYGDYGDNGDDSSGCSVSRIVIGKNGSLSDLGSRSDAVVVASTGLVLLVLNRKRQTPRK